MFRIFQVGVRRVWQGAINVCTKNVPICFLAMPPLPPPKERPFEARLVQVGSKNVVGGKDFDPDTGEIKEKLDASKLVSAHQGLLEFFPFLRSSFLTFFLYHVLPFLTFFLSHVLLFLRSSFVAFFFSHSDADAVLGTGNESVWTAILLGLVAVVVSKQIRPWRLFKAAAAHPLNQCRPCRPALTNRNVHQATRCIQKSSRRAKPNTPIHTRIGIQRISSALSRLLSPVVLFPICPHYTAPLFAYNTHVLYICARPFFHGKEPHEPHACTPLTTYICSSVLGVPSMLLSYISIYKGQQDESSNTLLGGVGSASPKRLCRTPNRESSRTLEHARFSSHPP